MNARSSRGNGTATSAARRERRAAAQPCYPLHPSQRSDPRPALSCKPEVEACAPVRVQGDRPRLYRGLEPRPSGAESVYPEGTPSARSTDPRPAPNLFNPPKGLSMAKIARDSLQLARKSVPVSETLRSARLPQTRPRETVIQRRYTLCEVDNGNRQFVPPRKAAYLSRQNRPLSGSSAASIFGGQKIPRWILSGSTVIPGLSLIGEIFSPKPKIHIPAPALGWHDKTPRKPIETVFGLRTGGAA